MQYLDRFYLPTEAEETKFILDHPKTGMTCYSGNIYPFRLFPVRMREPVSFSPITIFYGGNGSGKSTLLNMIAQSLELERHARFNRTPFFEEYVQMCSFDLTYGKRLPKGSRIITSDDVFDCLLDIRALNEGVDAQREALFDTYNELRQESYQLKSLEDYAELKRRREAWSGTRSAYARRRLPQNVQNGSNGESAFAYFTQEIREHALYLLDEPENSLSAKLQIKLAGFLEEAVRFYGCQIVFSTHSPFLLSIKGARIYDLDAEPICQRDWTELENVRAYRDFFRAHEAEFD